MASLQSKPGGRWQIQFTNPNKKRKTIRLGKVPKRAAETVKMHVEQLVSAAIMGQPPPDDTARWITRNYAIAEKLANVGLIPKRGSARLGEFLQEYFGKRMDVKPNTVRCWKQAKANLITFFGADRLITDVTAGDAKDFERFLKTEAKRRVKGKKKKGLSSNSVHKYVANAKQFFQDAVDHELLVKNPFDGLESGTRANVGRFFFVTREMAAKVLDACPNGETRLLFALCRYGGLRCPSEVERLRLNDVDWSRDRFLVHAPKTERHEGKATRWVPIFPELRPYLDEAWNAAETGQECFIKSIGDSRHKMRPIIRRAGLDVWPKLFQNLRSTRQTELEERFPSHVVCAWLGNSENVARKHYLQVTEDHFARALQNPTHEALQNVTKQPNAIGRNRTHERGEEAEDTAICVPMRSVASNCVEPPKSRDSLRETGQRVYSTS